MRAVVTVMLLLAGVAHADGGVPYVAPPGKDIVITAPGERTTKNLATLGAIAGAGIVVGAVGLYFNLDARDAANQVSARTLVDPLTGSSNSGRTWTTADQALVDRANSSSTKAEVFYSIGGAAVVAAVVAYIVTAPPEQRTVIHTHAAIAPTRGGAVVGEWWSW